MWQKYEDTGEITGKDETGLSFRLGDLIFLGKINLGIDDGL